VTTAAGDEGGGNGGREALGSACGRGCFRAGAADITGRSRELWGPGGPCGRSCWHCGGVEIRENETRALRGHGSPDGRGGWFTGGGNGNGPVEPLGTCWNHWLAVSTGDQAGVMDLLGLTRPVPVTFAEAKEVLDEDGHVEDDEEPDGYARVYVSPELDGWTLVLGAWCDPGDGERADEVLRLCTLLGERYGKAQAYYFGSRDDGSAWLVTEGGRVVRRYSEAGDPEDAELTLGAPLVLERARRSELGLPPDCDPEERGAGREEEWTWEAFGLAPEIAGALGVSPLELGGETRVRGTGVLALTPEGAASGLDRPDFDLDGPAGHDAVAHVRAGHGADGYDPYDDDAEDPDHDGDPDEDPDGDEGYDDLADELAGDEGDDEPADDLAGDETFAEAEFEDPAGAGPGRASGGFGEPVLGGPEFGDPGLTDADPGHPYLRRRDLGDTDLARPDLDSPGHGDMDPGEAEFEDRVPRPAHGV
jgi:hypothetical protein